MPHTPGKARFEPGLMVADRYEIKSVIGRGGMGQVYLAYDHRAHRDIALKTIHREFAANQDVLFRFAREVRLARQLDHPGVVKVYETEDWNGVVFYTMEYLRGRTLRSRLRDERRLDLATTVGILRQVCDALEHAHRITIHRDLSPDNIMLLDDGSVRLLDFGLAKLNDRLKGLTTAGTNLGKLMYMAPEQEQDAAGVDHRADLYSLGVIFFECLGGCTPHTGKKLAELCPGLPPETEEFLRRALARKREDRFSSAREFRDGLLQLERLHDKQAGVAVPAGTEAAGPKGSFFLHLLRLGTQHLLQATGGGAPAVASVERVPEEEAQEKTGRYESTDIDRLYRSFFQVPRDLADDAEVREVQRRLAAVYAANQAITSERKLSRVFDRILDEVFSLLSADTGVIMLKRPGEAELAVEYARSKSGSGKVQVSSTIVRRAFENGEAVITRNALEDPRFREGLSIIAQNITSAMCAPLTHRDERLGVIYVDSHGVSNAFTGGDLELLVALAGTAATAIRNAQYVRMVEQSYQDTLLVLANAIELRDHRTVGHIWRVASYAVEIARELGWDEAKIQEVRRGGMLHDVGKIAVDNAILSKEGALTEEEFAAMQVHPERGANLLGDVKFLRPVVPYCLYHHERWNGSGYPFGLRGDKIPMEGRLMAVADTFDAMTIDRPYRVARDFEAALQELLKGRGILFDPAVVDAFASCYRKGHIEKVLREYHKREARSLACPFCSSFIRPDAQTVARGELNCPVCHHRIRVLGEGRFYGELIVSS